MNKIKKTILILLMLSMTFLAFGCNGGNKVVSKKNQSVEYSKVLDGFMPEKPFEWKYLGFAEYAHKMSLTDVFETQSAKTYKLAGSVADLSDGVSDQDYGIVFKWMVTSDSILQEKSETKMMDSEFNKIIVLKEPLEKGNSWEEKLKFRNGSDGYIVSKITDVKDSESGKTVTVEYKDKLSDYYEVRKIREGVGLIYFEKLMRVDDQSFPVSYSLIEGNGAPIEKFIFKPKYEIGIDGKLSERYGVDSEFYKKNAKMIKTALVNYDKAWSKFVNEKDVQIFKYLLKDSSAYFAVRNFKNDGSKQHFEKIEVKKVTFETEKRARVIVFERIVKTRGDKEIIVEYFWSYQLQNVKNKWLIESYREFSG